jgi:renalase
MLIGIIGAGIAGLTAGRMLAQAGHEVIVFEKSRGVGGRLATRYADESKEIKFDHGCPHISGSDPRFTPFLNDMIEKKILQKWTDGFHYWSGEKLFDRHPQKTKMDYYFAPDGLNSIGKHMSRWVDVRNESKVIGMTYLGSQNGKKRPWMINLENFNVVEVDAIIFATPAIQTYGLIENSQNERIVKTVIKDIDTIDYNPKYSLMLTYNQAEMPDWKGIFCNDETLHWVSNESSKRSNDGKLTLVCHSRGDYTRNHLFKHSDTDIIKNQMILALRKIIGDWAGKYDESQSHLWRYSQPRTFFHKDFVEIGDANAPIGIIGDYMRGGTTEHAYISGYELAKSWIDKLPR